MAQKPEESTGQPTTIPVKYSFGGSLRRTTMGFPPRLEALRKKLATSFPEHAEAFAEQHLTLTYLDDEEDEITISTNDELLTAYELAHSAGKVLRFVVNEPEPKSDTESESESEPKPEPEPEPKAKPEPEPKAEAKAEPEPEPKAERLPQATQAENPFVAVASACYSTSLPKRVINALNEGQAVHFGRVCAVTGIAPIFGDVYLRWDDNTVSVSAAAYNELSEEEKQAFSLLSMPNYKRFPRWLKKHARFMGVPVHRGVTCEATKMKPIIGNRYRLKDGDYNLCEYAYRRLDEKDQALYELVMPDEGKRAWRSRQTEPTVHHGYTCDVTGMSPIVGTRWHKRGANYDLCDAEYQKLPPHEQAKFQAVTDAIPSWRGRCGGRRGWGRGFRGRPGFGGPPFAAGPPFVGFQAFGGWGCDNTPAPAPAPQQRRQRGKRPSSEPGAKFVKDLTVNDRSRHAPGQPFQKAWVMRASNGGVPAGCTLVFIGGHHLNAETLRVPVENAPIAEGKEFVLRIAFRAPNEPGHFRSFWRLQTPDGRRFGPRIWADIMVAEAPSQAATSNSAPVKSVKFVEDVTIPDGTVVLAGKPLRKTWLIATETGWGQNVVLKCLDTWSAFAGQQSAVPAVPPGSQADISITLMAPTAPGHYRTYWGFFAGDGTQFGESIFADFVVAAATDGGNTGAPAAPTSVDTVSESKDGETDGIDEQKDVVPNAEAEREADLDAILIEAAAALLSPETGEPATATTATATATATATTTTTATASTTSTRAATATAPIAATSTASTSSTASTVGPEGLTAEFLLRAIAQALPDSSSDQEKLKLYDLVFRGQQNGDFSSVIDSLKSLGFSL